MLTLTIKITLFLAVVLALAFGVHHLLNAPEGDGVTVVFRGYEHKFRPFAAAMVVLAISLGLYIGYRLIGLVFATIKFIAGDETAITRYFDRANERKGVVALAHSVEGLISGDTKKARVLAQRAERLMKRPEVTRLVNARSAELAGETDRAKAYYTALADEPDTAFAGVSGLLRIAQKEGDQETAMILARTAAGLRSDHGETLETLYTLQSQKYDWEGARVTLGAQRRAKLLDEADANRRDSMLVLAQASDAEDGGRSGDALKLALEAVKIDPSNPDAAEKAARLLAAEGAQTKASKVLIDTWKVAPSTRVSQAFADLVPDESPEARRKRFGDLFASNPGAVETQYARAELALGDGDHQGARDALGKITESDPSARYCVIMAAILGGEGADESEIRDWLNRAATAPSRGGAAVSESMLVPMLLAGRGRAAPAQAADDTPADESTQKEPETAG